MRLISLEAGSNPPIPCQPVLRGRASTWCSEKSRWARYEVPVQASMGSTLLLRRTRLPSYLESLFRNRVSRTFSVIFITKMRRTIQLSLSLRLDLVQVCQNDSYRCVNFRRSGKSRNNPATRFRSLSRSGDRGMREDANAGRGRWLHTIVPSNSTSRSTSTAAICLKRDWLAEAFARRVLR